MSRTKSVQWFFSTLLGEFVVKSHNAGKIVKRHIDNMRQTLSSLCTWNVQKIRSSGQLSRNYWSSLIHWEVSRSRWWSRTWRANLVAQWIVHDATTTAGGVGAMPVTEVHGSLGSTSHRSTWLTWKHQSQKYMAYLEAPVTEVQGSLGSTEIEAGWWERQSQKYKAYLEAQK